MLNEGSLSGIIMVLCHELTKINSVSFQEFSPPEESARERIEKEGLIVTDDPEYPPKRELLQNK